MCKILLVDDEYLEREALRIIINKGYKDAEIVGETGLGKQAIELSESLNPDIIFMDIKMPGIDGIEASRIIKEKNKDRIIIVLTAYEEFEFAHRAIRAKVDDYILKPARPENIIQSIKRHFNDKNEISNEQNNIDTLLDAINNCNYKKSKEALNKLIDISLQVHDNDTKKIKEFIKVVCDSMIKVSKEMDLNIDELIMKRINNSQMSLVDYYSIRTDLYKLLEKIFDKIIKEKLYDSQSEMEMVLNYIEKNICEGVGLEEVADYVNLSPYYLSKLFKKEFGINFINYVTNRKIEEAKELLEKTDLPIINISLELSFNEPNYFSKVFKKVVGVTPSQYREKKKSYKAKHSNQNLLSKNVTIANSRWYI